MEANAKQTDDAQEKTKNGSDLERTETEKNRGQMETTIQTHKLSPIQSAQPHLRAPNLGFELYFALCYHADDQDASAHDRGSGGMWLPPGGLVTHRGIIFCTVQQQRRGVVR